MENVLNCIDLFCGCGGLSLGFEKAGINVLVGIDAWQDAITTFNYNHKNSKGICADLSTLEPSEIEKELNGKSVDLIIGGPPCQGFSVAGKRIVDDVRNKLYKIIYEDEDKTLFKTTMQEIIDSKVSNQGKIKLLNI